MDNENEVKDQAQQESPAQEMMPEQVPATVPQETQVVVQDSVERRLAIELRAAGARENQIQWLLAVRNIAAGAYKDMLCAVHGGLFQLFAEIHDERLQTSEALRAALERLKKGGKSAAKRRQLIYEVDVLSRAVAAQDEAMARINQLIQNSVFTLAMHMARKSGKLGYTAYDNGEEG